MSFVLATLAAWRLARMVALETGPFELFQKLRYFVVYRTNPGSWIDEGIHCPLCLSFWTALLMTFLVLQAGDGWREFILYWFGISGGAAAVHLLLVERD